MFAPSIRQLSWLAIAALLTATFLWAEDAAKKAAVPEEAAQAEAMKLLKEVYGGELAAAKTPEQKKALVKKLLEKAAGTQDDLTSKYVLLKAAKAVAMQAIDAEMAFETIDRMAESFDVNASEMKTGVLKSLAAKAHLPAEHASLAELALGLVDQAMATDSFARAMELANLALASARKAHNAQLLQEAHARLADCQKQVKEFEAEKTAQATLDKTPDDPDANLAVGKYLCFTKGDWDRGLPKFALGKDEDLRALAMTELKGVDSSSEQAKLGDGWWDLAEKQNGAVKARMRQRAGYWYQKALPELSGLMKDKIEKRLAQLAAEPSPKAQGGPVRGIPLAAIAPFNEKTAKQHQARWARYLHVSVVQANSIAMKLVLIPPGEFTMGSPKELVEDELRAGGDGWYKDRLRRDGEAPQHHVRITKAYWLAATPVTQEEYQRVMDINRSRFQGDPKRPVDNVTWDESLDFCRRLSELPGEKAAKRQYGLPTEAQWEYACRAGTTTHWYSGDDEAGLDDVAWFSKNAGGMTHVVAQKRANAWGLYDIHGNVWEWCQDRFDAGYYANSPADDPPGPRDGSDRVSRGGGWDGCGGRCRSAFRHGTSPGFRGDVQGFRVCMVPAEK